MGSKPDTSGADAATALAQKQYDDAQKKEALRQQHLTEGKAKIDQVFSGAPVYKTTANKFDWSKFVPTQGTYDRASNSYLPATGTNLPTGYTAVQVADPHWQAGGGSTPYTAAGSGTPGTSAYIPPATSFTPGGSRAAAAPASTRYDPLHTNASVSGGCWSGLHQLRRSRQLQRADARHPVIRPGRLIDQCQGCRRAAGQRGGVAVGGRWRRRRGQQGPGQVWAVKGPDGKIYYQGDDLNYNTQTQTGTSGGFDQAFYDKFAADYVKPGNQDISDQYNTARENLQYALARQGLSSSSAGNQGSTDLVAAKKKASGDLTLQAQQAVGNVKDQIANEKAAAISQLYATEDPTLAANTALSKSQNITANAPSYSGLGDIFGKVIGGFGNVLNAAKSSGYFSNNRTPYAQSAKGV